MEEPQMSDVKKETEEVVSQPQNQNSAPMSTGKKIMVGTGIAYLS